MNDVKLKMKINFLIDRIRSLECKIDAIDCSGTATNWPEDPMASANGIDALWTFEGISSNPLTLPNEPTYIYTFHRNGIEQNESQYDITGTSLSVFPALGSINGGNPEILELRYKYIN